MEVLVESQSSTQSLNNMSHTQSLRATSFQIKCLILIFKYLLFSIFDTIII